MKYGFLLAVLAVFVAPLKAATITVVDQAQDTYLNGVAVFGINGIQRAQTFTAGVSGNLSGIDLRIITAFADEFILTIYDVVDGIPLEVGATNQIISGGIFPEAVIEPGSGLPLTYDASLYQWTTIDITDLNIVVNPGDMLAFGLGIPGTQTTGYFGIIMGSGSDTYAGGAAFVRDIDGNSAFGPAWTEQSTDLEMAFRTRVTVVPLPAAIWLLVSALGLLCGLRLKVL